MNGPEAFCEATELINKANSNSARGQGFYSRHLYGEHDLAISLVEDTSFTSFLLKSQQGNYEASGVFQSRILAPHLAEAWIINWHVTPQFDLRKGEYNAPIGNVVVPNRIAYLYYDGREVESLPAWAHFATSGYQPEDYSPRLVNENRSDKKSDKDALNYCVDWDRSGETTGLRIWPIAGVCDYRFGVNGKREGKLSLRPVSFLSSANMASTQEERDLRQCFWSRLPKQLDINRAMVPVNTPAGSFEFAPSIDPEVHLRQVMEYSKLASILAHLKKKR